MSSDIETSSIPGVKYVLIDSIPQTKSIFCSEKDEMDEMDEIEKQFVKYFLVDQAESNFDEMIPLTQEKLDRVKRFTRYLTPKEFLESFNSKEIIND